MTERREGPSPGRPWLVLGIFLLAAIWIAWLRQPALTTPVWNVDEGITAAIADEILAGGVPYRDATDLRAPLTYYLYAAVFAIAGDNNMDAIHVTHTLLVVATALLVLLIGRRIDGIVAGGWSLWLYAALACCLFNPMDNLALHTEWPLAFCSALGAWLFLTGHLRGGLGWFIGTGIFYGLAALSKQPALLDFGAPLALQAWCLLTGPRPESGRRWREAAALVIGFALPLLLTVLYFSARGALDDFVFYTWTYNTRYYVPEVPLAVRFPTIRVPLELLHHFAPSLLALLVLSVLVTVYYFFFRPAHRRGDRAVRLLLAPVWLLGSLGATTLSGRGFEHYSIQLLAPASLVAGQLLGPLTAWSLVGLRRLQWRLAPALLVSGALIATVTVQLHHCLSYRAAIQPHKDPSVAMAKIVREVTTREDRLFVWGFYSDFHPLSDRLPASRYVHGAFLTGLIPWTNLGRDTSYAIVPESMDKLLTDLEKHRPRVIVDASQALNRQFQNYSPEKFPPFLAYLQQHYIEYEPQRSIPRGWFHFYLRKDPAASAPVDDNTPRAPVGILKNITQDFSGRAKIVIHGSDPSGQLQQLGICVGTGDMHTVTFPPAAERLLVISIPYPATAGDQAPVIRIVARSTDGRHSISAPQTWTASSEQPKDLHLTTAAGPVPVDQVSAAFKPVPVEQEGQAGWLCHAYTALRFPLPAGPSRLRFGHGLAPGAYEKISEHTDGVEFIVQYQPQRGSPRVLYRRLLNPAENAADRGLQSGEVEVPPPHPGDSLVLITHPGPAYNTAFDWSYWTTPMLEPVATVPAHQP
ncbi:MAG TPA: glycosyltransferase family 39 protein [Lacunisphaera sp.]